MPCSLGIPAGHRPALRSISAPAIGAHLLVRPPKRSNAPRSDRDSAGALSILGFSTESFRIGLRFGSVTGSKEPAPSPKPRTRPKILAAHRCIISVDALANDSVGPGLGWVLERAGSETGAPGNRNWPRRWWQRHLRSALRRKGSRLNGLNNPGAFGVIMRRDDFSIRWSKSRLRTRWLDLTNATRCPTLLAQ